MPIIDHDQAPETPWRPRYRKWDIAGHEQGVTSTLSVNLVEAGAGAPLHTHTMDELIVILEGSLEATIGGESQTVGKDHTLVVPPGVAHGFRAGDEGARLLVFFPVLDPYDDGHTHYLEGGRPNPA